MDSTKCFNCVYRGCTSVEYPCDVCQFLNGALFVSCDAPAAPKKKLKICELLGVRVGETFCIDGYSGADFQIEEDGTYRTFPANAAGSCKALLLAIEHPDRVRKVTLLTPQEMSDLASIVRLFGDGWIHITRDEDGILCLDDNEGDGGYSEVGIDMNLFPSVKPGTSIKIADYVKIPKKS